MQFKDFIKENIINESSMTRFISKFQQHDAVIITAFRNGVIKRNKSGEPVKNKSGKNKGQWIFSKFFTRLKPTKK